MKTIRRVRQCRLESPPDDGSPWIADVRTYDMRLYAFLWVAARILRHTRSGVAGISI